MLTAAEVRYDQDYQRTLRRHQFQQPGCVDFFDLTSKNVKKRLAIILDDHVYSAPVIQEQLPAAGRRSREAFTTNEAKDLAIALRAGALPAPVTMLENRTVGPSLGRDSVEAGINSIIIGMVAVVVFILIYYRLSGVVAVGALVLNLIILLGALAYFGASLTLPGLPGSS